MVIGMAVTTKVTITLRNDQLKQIRSLVASGKTESVSGFVQHAVAVGLIDAAGWADALKEALEQTGGPLTQKEREWAEAILSATPTKKKSGRTKTA